MCGVGKKIKSALVKAKSSTTSGRRVIKKSLPHAWIAADSVLPCKRADGNNKDDGKEEMRAGAGEQTTRGQSSLMRVAALLGGKLQLGVVLDFTGNNALNSEQQQPAKEKRILAGGINTAFVDSAL